MMDMKVKLDSPVSTFLFNSSKVKDTDIMRDSTNWLTGSSVVKSVLGR